ncbi:MAG TPA: histidine kinase dimerization/phospho-acceptor domain-containing protein, partial [Flavisolibacter sp.]|nr:histidine kinase dimerization/phospho-acceptor domain-containing protein [Flavisolibacter sp.]
MSVEKNTSEQVNEIELLRLQLEEANETIEAIRTGQIDAFVVRGKNGHELYTLKSADQTYRVFIEKMTEGAVTLNDEKIIMYSNSRFAAMVNLPLSDVIGKYFPAFIAMQNQNEFEQLFIKGFKEDCKAEIELVGNNCCTPTLISLTSLELDEGISLSIILTDLSAQKETQRQLKLKNEQLEQTNLALELSNTDLQQFAYVASHDLQEPLRKIILYTSHLKEKQDSLPVQSIQFLEKIISSSIRMKSLILDILNYSRLAS